MSRPLSGMALLLLVVCQGEFRQSRSRADDVRPAARILRIAPDRHQGLSGAVVVEELPLVYTAQLFPRAGESRDAPVAGKQVNEQLSFVLSTLDDALKSARTDLDHLVKLNVYAVTDEVADQVRTELAIRLQGRPLPAVSFVTSPLPYAGALLALDAIAAVEESRPEKSDRHVALERVVDRPEGGRQSRLAVQSALTTRIYISGQAEASAEMGEATRKTMQSLERTLHHLGLTLGDVVQIKSFLGPLAKVADAEREIARSFGRNVVPPLVFVEWQSTLPIEIELVAIAPRAAETAPPVEYLTPPDMKPSPVFCRVTRVNAPETIFVSGLYGSNEMGVATEVESTFTNLSGLLAEAGSDLRHMAKATYYVTTDEASNRLNEIRPRLYDPERPPAASKAVVSGSGRPGRSLALDMIAVRKPSAHGK